MTPEQHIANEFTELVRALRQIADALTASATIAQRTFDKRYPERRDVRDATITIVESAEEKARRERIQGSESTTDEWREIGPREAEFLKSYKPRS